MPNYCDNDLYILGKNRDIDAVLAFIGGSREKPTFDFAQVVPPPDVPYDPVGYEWRIANWGTKWNARPTALVEVCDGVRLTFETAWSPPYPIVKALALRFSAVVFHLEYSECGMQFCGGVTYNEDPPRRG